MPQAVREYRKAVHAFEEAVRLEPNDPRGPNDLAWLLTLSKVVGVRDPARAVELARRSVELDPHNGNGWTTLGMAHYYAGDYQDAAAALKKAAALHSGGPGAIAGYQWFFLAMAHWKLGNREEGRRWYDTARTWMETNYPGHKDLRRFRAEAALLGLDDKPSAKTKEVPPGKE
jgi:cytochrome c-type biogenesis protein CcmH/NrfG